MVDMKQCLIALILLNVCAFIYGLYYYTEQLNNTPVLLWLFTIDCPLYSILLAVVFCLAVLKRSSSTLNFVAATGAMKYGVWTMFVLLFYGDFFFASPFYLQSAFLFVGHLGLFLEGVLLIGTTNIDLKVFSMCIVWFLINDWLDYGVGIHPFLPESAETAGRISTVAALTIFASLAIPVLAFLAWREKMNVYSWNRFLTRLRNAIGGGMP
jgi:uncharacterized membrane protein YpjA